MQKFCCGFLNNKMPRSKIVNFDEVSGSVNPSRPASSRGTRGTAVHPDFAERLRVFGEKECHPERGIEVDELGGTQIPTVIQARGWEDFVLNPPPYNERIVREFYAAMIVQDYYKGGAVMVRGKPVRIQAADINRYHKTTLENPIPTGVEHQTLFVRQNLRWANSLVVEPMTSWHAKNNPIRQSRLTKELAFWHTFTSYNLRPSKHLSTVSFDVAKILYAFQAELDIDVGHLIKMEIGRVGDSKRSDDILPFPCLITTFCREAGIDMSDPADAAAFYLPQGMMDAGTWSGLQKTKKGQVPTGESSTPGRKKRRTAVDDDDRWYSEAALHDDEDAAGGLEDDIPRDGRRQTPVERILAAIKASQVANQAAIQEVRTDIQQQFTTMDNNWRFDMTELRQELGLSVYSRRRGPTTSSASAAPVGGPVLDEGGAMRRAMELSRKEAADRAAAEKDPRGKRVV